VKLLQQIDLSHLVLQGSDIFMKRTSIKKRLILELIENLVLNFPELDKACRLSHSTSCMKCFLTVSSFPLNRLRLQKLTHFLVIHQEEALKVYNQALKQLETEGKIEILNGYITISKLS